MERKLGAGRIRGGGQKERYRAARHPQKGSMGTSELGAKGSRGWALGVEYQGRGCARGGQMRQDAKGLRPICLDADLPVRRYWMRPFHFQMESARGDVPRTGVYVISASSVRHKW